MRTETSCISESGAKPCFAFSDAFGIEIEIGIGFGIGIGINRVGVPFEEAKLEGATKFLERESYERERGVGASGDETA